MSRYDGLVQPRLSFAFFALSRKPSAMFSSQGLKMLISRRSHQRRHSHPRNCRLIYSRAVKVISRHHPSDITRTSQGSLITQKKAGKAGERKVARCTKGYDISALKRLNKGEPMHVILKESTELASSALGTSAVLSAAVNGGCWR